MYKKQDSWLEKKVSEEKFDAHLQNYEGYIVRERWASHATASSKQTSEHDLS